jgi:Uma2 family endonuclease
MQCSLRLPAIAVIISRKETIMTALRKPEDQMTIAEFLAFTATRPNEERWELIEGIAHMNASPTDWHQRIVLNVCTALDLEAGRINARWDVIPGIGTRVPVSPRSLPQPDVQVLEHGLGATPSSTTSDSIVLFEILSKSNTRTDQAWRKRVYASIPNLQHYVVVSQKAALVTRFDRADGWTSNEAKGLRATVALPALGAGVSLQLADIYKKTAIGA